MMFCDNCGGSQDGSIPNSTVDPGGAAPCAPTYRSTQADRPTVIQDCRA